MNPFSFLSTIAAVAYLQLGFYVRFHLDRERGRLPFFLFSISYAIWSVEYAFMSSAVSPQTAWRLTHLFAFSYTLSAPLFLHFAARFTSRTWSRTTWIFIRLMYVLGAVFMIRAMTSGLVVERFVRYTAPWSGSVWLEVSRTDVWAISYVVYYNLCVIGSLFMFAIWAATSNTARAREQGRIIISSFAVTLLLIAYNGFLEPLVPPPFIPRVPHLITLIFLVGVVYAIWKYGFLRDAPRTVLDTAIWQNLTRRERDVAVLLLEGLSYKEISAKLDISMNTVKTHVEHVYEKADVASRSQLTAVLLSFTPGDLAKSSKT